MNLHISQVIEDDQFYVKLEISKDFKDFVWQELKKSIKYSSFIGKITVKNATFFI